MSDPEKQQISVTLDRHNVDWMDSDGKNRSGFINDLVSEARTGGSSSDAARRLRINQIRSELQSKQDQQQRLEQELERLQTHVDAAEQEYTDALEDLLDDMERDVIYMDASAPRVRDIADMAPTEGHSAEDVMDDLRDMAFDQGRDIGDDQWGSKR